VIAVEVRHDDRVEAADAEAPEHGLDAPGRPGRATVDEPRPRSRCDDGGVALPTSTKTTRVTAARLVVVALGDGLGFAVDGDGLGVADGVADGSAVAAAPGEPDGGTGASAPVVTEPQAPIAAAANSRTAAGSRAAASAGRVPRRPAARPRAGAPVPAGSFIITG
jgi:hypothetical protein